MNGSRIGHSPEMRLIDHIAAADPLTRIWYSSGAVVRRGQVLAYLDTKARAFSSRDRLNVALITADPGSLFLSLVFFDGLADQILILPANLSPQLVKSFVEQSESNRYFFCGMDTPPQGFEPSLSFADLSKTNGEARLASQTSRRTKDTRWIIPTSGTTGVPKLVGHRLDSLTRSLQQEKSKGSKFTWGLAYDPSRFAGLQVFLQALCGGSCLVLPKEVTNLERLPSELCAGGCNSLSATPSLWRKLLMANGSEKIDFKIISMGGEIADQGVLSALASRYPDARLTHIYASTEAGVGFSVRDGRAGFPVSFIRNSPGGVQLKVSEEGYLLLKPAQCSQAYIAGDTSMTDENGWINTGDLVERRGSRYYFIGRANGSINVGGQKVHPQEVEEVILGVSDVALVKVFGRRNSILGNLVEAYVLPGNGAEPDLLRTAVNQACADSLDEYKRPVVVQVVDQIETTSAGKIVRT